jgi:hypothetical protein
VSASREVIGRNGPIGTSVTEDVGRTARCVRPRHGSTERLTHDSTAVQEHRDTPIA